MKVGTTLNNGAVVIDSRPGIVLCVLPSNAVTPYATWAVDVVSGAPFSGHYFYGGELLDAVEDFQSRI